MLARMEWDRRREPGRRWLIWLAVACVLAALIIAVADIRRAAAQGAAGNTPAGSPAGSTQLAAGVTGSTGAVSAALPGGFASTTFVCGIDVSAIGGTAAVGPITLGPLVGGVTFTWQGSASAAGGPILQKEFTPCIPASAPNTAITATTTADGTATAVDVNLHGYRTAQSP